MTPATALRGGPCVSVALGQGAKRLSADPRAAVSIDDEQLTLIERADARISITCQRLIKLDGAPVGFFTSGLAARCARHAWAQAGVTLRSITTTLRSSEVEQVEAGDGLRLDLIRSEAEVGPRCADWMDAGAVEVRVSRIVLNAWDGPQPAREQHPGAVGATFYQLVVVAPTC